MEKASIDDVACITKYTVAYVLEIFATSSYSLRTPWRPSRGTAEDPNKPQEANRKLDNARMDSYTVMVSLGFTGV